LKATAAINLRCAELSRGIVLDAHGYFKLNTHHKAPFYTPRAPIELEYVPASQTAHVDAPDGHNSFNGAAITVVNLQLEKKVCC
jgi:hypothetical protein